MKNRLAIALLSSAVLSLPAAHASTITSATVYQGIPDPGNSADPANTGATLASANFTIGASGINFASGATFTTASFLNNPTFSNTKNGFNPNGTADSNELIISGVLNLLAGNNTFLIGHDDGAVVNVTGIGTVLNAPGPMTEALVPFTVVAPTAGNYNFNLNYAECCGQPADLLFQVNGQTVGGVSPVPEPSSIALLGTGLLSLGGIVRRRFNR